MHLIHWEQWGRHFCLIEALLFFNKLLGPAVEFQPRLLNTGSSPVKSRSKSGLHKLAIFLAEFFILIERRNVGCPIVEFAAVHAQVQKRYAFTSSRKRFFEFCPVMTLLHFANFRVKLFCSQDMESQRFVEQLSGFAVRHDFFRSKAGAERISNE